MSAGVARVATWLPAAVTLAKGDGRAVESSDQAGVPAAPATAGPPALTRYSTVEDDAGLASPDSDTRSGVLDPVWVTLSVAERGPGAVGRKVTATVIDWPGPRLWGVPSSKPSENIGASPPEMAVDWTMIVPEAAPLRSTTSWVAACPTGIDGRLTDAGSATRGVAPGSGATPVPDRGMLSAPGPEWLTRSVADRGPVAVGENDTRHGERPARVHRRGGGVVEVVGEHGRVGPGDADRLDGPRPGGRDVGHDHVPGGRGTHRRRAEVQRRRVRLGLPARRGAGDETRQQRDRAARAARPGGATGAAPSCEPLRRAAPARTPRAPPLLRPAGPRRPPAARRSCRETHSSRYPSPGPMTSTCPSCARTIQRTSTLSVRPLGCASVTPAASHPGASPSSRAPPAPRRHREGRRVGRPCPRPVAPARTRHCRACAAMRR